MTFLKDRTNGVTWKSPVRKVVTRTWGTVVDQYNRATFSSGWTSYQALIRDSHRRAKNLSDAIDAFAWRSDIRDPMLQSMGVPFSPVWIHHRNDWFRLFELLERIGAKVRPQEARALSEIDATYLASVDLVRSRLDAVVEQLDIAARAAGSIPGKPRGSRGVAFARALRSLWESETTKKATVSRSTGKPTGPFVTYCELARNLLPHPHREAIPLTRENIAEAARRKLGIPPRG
jgi:hypothetical protein